MPLLGLSAVSSHTQYSSWGNSVVLKVSRSEPAANHCANLFAAWRWLFIIEGALVRLMIAHGQPKLTGTL